MNKIAKQLKNNLSVIVAIVIAVMAVVTVSKAVQPNVINIANVENLSIGSGEDSLGAFSQVASATRLTDLIITNDLRVDNEAEFTATTTLNGYSLGSNRFEAFSFTAGSTTTVGGLFSIPNTGEVKICRDVITDFSTIAGAGSITFSVGTSTSATAWSASGGSLIASTTLATSTPNIFDQRTFKGSFFGGTNNGVLDTTYTDQYQNATPTLPWIWSNGDFLNGAFDAGASSAAQGSASSSVYTSNVGAVYVECFQR